VVAFSLLALKLTSHAVLIAGVAIASRLPWLFVALPAGAIVDKVDRRHLVVTVDLLRAVVLGVVAIGALTHRLDLVEVYAAAFLIGAGETVVAAASRASIPLIVRAENVPAANGNLLGAQTFGLRFAGPALGGFVFSVAAAIPFFGDSISYFFSAALLRRAIPATTDPVRASAVHVTADIRAGLRYFLGTPVLRIVAGVVGSFAFCQSMVFGVLVIYATRVLGLGQIGYGVILSVAAIGDLAASLLARRLHARLGPYATIVAAGCAAAIGYLMLGSTSHKLLAVIGLALEAAATAVGNVASLSLRHRSIPTSSFGIVNNAIGMVIAGLVPAGALLGGVLAGIYGTRTTFIIAGALQLVVITMLAFPLRKNIPAGSNAPTLQRDLATTSRGASLDAQGERHLTRG
jgi:MFS family permease